MAHAAKDVNAEVGWGVFSIIILGLAAAALGGYAVYKYRIRVHLKFIYLTSYNDIYIFIHIKAQNVNRLVLIKM